MPSTPSDEQKPTRRGRALRSGTALPGPSEQQAWDWLWLGVVLAALAVILLLLGPALLSRWRRPTYKSSALFEVQEKSSPSAVLTAPDEHSVAVLPFENLSDDKESGYFADGVQDEIVTRLAKVGSLKVISRTSTLRYGTSPTDTARIARELGVANLLEGSVRRAGDVVRVNLQLIDAGTDHPRWAESYDRKLTDLFGVQSEIALAVADQLRVALTAPERAVLTQAPTGQLDAYDAYLRGLAFSLNPVVHTDNVEGARRHLKEAVRLDPSFALAWAQLALVDSRAYRLGTLPQTPTLLEEARAAADNAYRLQPKLGETLLAQGFFHYACLHDSARAEEFYQQASALLPNSALIPEYLAYLTRRRGEWERAAGYFAAAVRLDPRNQQTLYQQALLYKAMRRWPEALDAFDRVLELSPGNTVMLANKAGIYHARGELARAAAVLAAAPRTDEDNELTIALEMQAYLERDPARAVACARQLTAHPDPEDARYNASQLTSLGEMLANAGDDAGARSAWEKARAADEALYRDQPDNLSVLNDLCIVYARLGDKENAVKLAQHAVEVTDAAHDAMSGPLQREYLAQVYLRVGEPQKAIDLIRRLLTVPYLPAGANPPLTPAILRLNPDYDPLRSSPEFQQLCEQDSPR